MNCIYNYDILDVKWRHSKFIHVDQRCLHLTAVLIAYILFSRKHFGGYLVLHGIPIGLHIICPLSDFVYQWKSEASLFFQRNLTLISYENKKIMRYEKNVAQKWGMKLWLLVTAMMIRPNNRCLSLFSCGTAHWLNACLINVPCWLLYSCPMGSGNYFPVDSACNKWWSSWVFLGLKALDRIPLSQVN